MRYSPKLAESRSGRSSGGRSRGGKYWGARSDAGSGVCAPAALPEPQSGSNDAKRAARAQARSALAGFPAQSRLMPVLHHECGASASEECAGGSTRRESRRGPRPTSLQRRGQRVRRAHPRCRLHAPIRLAVSFACDIPAASRHRTPNLRLGPPLLQLAPRLLAPTTPVEETGLDPALESPRAGVPLAEQPSSCKEAVS